MTLPRLASVTAVVMFLSIIGPADFAFAQQAEDTRPLAEQPYIGLRFEDHQPTGACLVTWVLPGPLFGEKDPAPLVNSGDLILKVDGKNLKADELQKYVAAKKPGDEMTLTVRFTKMPPNTYPFAPGEGTETKDLKIRLAARADWAGPISFPRQKYLPLKPETLLDPAKTFSFEALVMQKAGENNLTDAYNKLCGVLKEAQSTTVGYNNLARVAYPFYYPLRMSELQEEITAPLADYAKDPSGICSYAAKMLDLSAYKTKNTEKANMSIPRDALKFSAKQVAAANEYLRKAFEKIPADHRATLAEDIDTLVAGLPATVYVAGHKNPARMIKTLQASMSIDFSSLILAAGEMSELIQRGTPPAKDTKTVEIPQEMQNAVTGDVLDIVQIDGRWYVYGGFGANTYDMSKITGVIDAGGDDTYNYPQQAPWTVRFIIDMAGNDRHIGSAGGPAAALCGISLLVDYAGDDFYAGQKPCCGAGIMGVGMLIDYDGNDEYQSLYWSQGAGFYGFGLIADLGYGRDLYQSQIMSQGIGGPRGLGLILEQGGEDYYRVNGPVKSSYGTPGVYNACSQGFGFGCRTYESGGIGIIEDLEGNDRYDAGEMAQGGGYYYGLGILHDRKGNDSYTGVRWAQGFGCHQAHGILADDEGDDTYYALQVAIQGSAWDIAVGALIDRAGNDSYQCGAGLSQGGASMQGVAYLMDLAGRDRYIAPPYASQGKSGGNSYHYARTGAMSFSVLFDSGGDDDLYSTGRPNNKTISVGEPDEKNPAESPLYGLFIDTAGDDLAVMTFKDRFPRSVKCDSSGHITSLGLRKETLTTEALTEADFDIIASLTHLELLALSESNVSDETVAKLMNLRSLKRLYLGDTAVSDTGLRELAALSEMEWLELDNTKITGKTLPAITKMSKIQHVGISTTAVTEADIRDLAWPLSLRTLVVSQNMISKATIEKLKKDNPNLEVIISD